jgi:hypothetical protein
MKTGRDQYAEEYANQLRCQAEWLAYGAIEKANSVELLLKRYLKAPESLIELGAGTGAIIAELRQRKIAKKYIAVEYSKDACAYMEKNLDGVQIIQADIVNDAIEYSADVIVLSHVLEHLELPDKLLSTIKQNIKFRYLIIECPLEDLLMCRVKNLFRDRNNNSAKHVHFYNKDTLKIQIQKHFNIIEERYYCPWAPIEVINFLVKKDKLTKLSKYVKYMTMNVLPRFMPSIWRKYWLGNYAVLCTRKNRAISNSRL